MSRESFLAYQRALHALAQARIVARRTDDPRHIKHAKVLHEIAAERHAAWQADLALLRAQLAQRDHP